VTRVLQTRFPEQSTDGQRLELPAGRGSEATQFLKICFELFAAKKLWSVPGFFSKVKDRGTGFRLFPRAHLYQRHGLYKVPASAGWNSAHALA
jgi:hypothetical protein